MLIPMSLAVSKSFETALMAIPIFVLFVMKSTTNSKMIVTTGVTNVATDRDTLPKLIARVKISMSGNPFGTPVNK
ncbi:hypothetical protein DSECCO2_618150 [anaerobic digester metagenome]